MRLVEDQLGDQRIRPDRAGIDGALARRRKQAGMSSSPCSPASTKRPTATHCGALSASSASGTRGRSSRKPVATSAKTPARRSAPRAGAPWCPDPDGARCRARRSEAPCRPAASPSSAHSARALVAIMSARRGWTPIGRQTVTRADGRARLRACAASPAACSPRPSAAARTRLGRAHRRHDLAQARPALQRAGVHLREQRRAAIRPACSAAAADPAADAVRAQHERRIAEPALSGWCPRSHGSCSRRCTCRTASPSGSAAPLRASGRHRRRWRRPSPRC